MNKETEIWLEEEKLNRKKETWDNFANSAWLLAEFYPEIEKSDIRLMLNRLGLIEEGNK